MRTALAVAVAVLVPLGVAHADTARSLKNRAVFSDPTGDNTLTAPDITRVTVENDDAGVISFEIAVANYSSLQGRISFVVFLDTDRKSETGNSLGADYALTFGYRSVNELTRGVGRWKGVEFIYSQPPAYSASYSAAGEGGVAKLVVNHKNVGMPRDFDFAVYGYWFVQPIANYYWDVGPDQHGQRTFWSYQVVPGSKGAADSDHDGIPDAGDKCPRAGALFDFNRNGCTGPFRRMRPDLKFRALGYSSYITMVASRIENLPPGARVEVRCQSACRVRARQTARSPVVVLTELHGKRLTRGAAVEIRAVKPGWIGYYARIAITGTPLATHTTERCLPAIGEQVPTPCGRIERGR